MDACAERKVVGLDRAVRGAEAAASDRPASRPQPYFCS